METALDGKSSLKQAVDVNDDLKDRLKQIIGRIEKLKFIRLSKLISLQIYKNTLSTLTNDLRRVTLAIEYLKSCSD